MALSIAQLLDYILTEIKRGVRAAIPIILLVIVTLIGATIFWYIEAPYERQLLQDLMVSRENHLNQAAYDISRLRWRLNSRVHYKFTSRALEQYRRQLGVADVNLDNVKWTFSGAIFYALTVYTTIGYGNIYPETSLGRVFTVFYAFLSIPLALLSIIALGALFAKICKLAWFAFMHSFTKKPWSIEEDLERKKRGNDLSATDDNNDDDLLNFPVSFLLLITLAYIFVCAALFLTVEKDWNYGTSLYFTIISFTTIGFGDVLPSNPEYMILVGVLLLLGLSLVSTVLNIIQQQIEALACRMHRDIEKNYDRQLQEGREGKLANFSDIEKQLNDRRTSGDQRRMSFFPTNQMKERLLFKMMPAGHQKSLQQHAEARLKLRTSGTQTDIWLIMSFDLMRIKSAPDIRHTIPAESKPNEEDIDDLKKASRLKPPLKPYTKKGHLQNVAENSSLKLQEKNSETSELPSKSVLVKESDDTNEPNARFKRNSFIEPMKVEKSASSGNAELRRQRSIEVATMEDEESFEAESVDDTSSPESKSVIKDSLLNSGGSEEVGQITVQQYPRLNEQASGDESNLLSPTSRKQSAHCH
ncbi:hypothetical protein AB6A40_001800 [Gnathostoma spinigerum]|uniref:Potassium channel domain-containing protein n=1 Tax=Gnathostoma spinigerum TaxID=75299 RepID=A0ABD6E7F6_9BILA